MKIINLFSSILSCRLNCLKLIMAVICKKIILGIIIIGFLGACKSTTAMLGPAYTLSATGNVYQTGLSYASNQMIAVLTGKTPFENLKRISPKKENIQKKTLESEEFYSLVQEKIQTTSNILRLSSQ